MTKKQLELLLDYIDARIRELAEDRLGGDSLYEAVAAIHARDELMAAFNFEDRYNETEN